MADSSLEWKKYFPFPGHNLLLCGLYLLPALSPSLFGWISGLLAAPLLYVMWIQGDRSSLVGIWVSLAVAGVGALVVQRFEVFLFSLTLVPLGYSLFVSAQKKEPAATSGCKGVITLALTWSLYWGLFGAVIGVNPYNSLLQAVDMGLQQTLEIYRSKEVGLPPEAVYNLQEITSSMRVTAPKILPGVLGAMVILTVWMTMVIVNGLIGRRSHGETPWGRYLTWKLPDHLVWLPILAVILLLVGKGVLQYTGGCLLLVSSLLYFFQGMAVVLSLLERWHVPVFMRIMLYGVLFIQSYSVVFVAVLGLGDVWFNMRKQSEVR
jgi:uncharacterized protein YybS (DUF2232 family)